MLGIVYRRCGNRGVRLPTYPGDYIRCFPARVKTLAAKELREAKDERRIWELAESGWKKTLKSHRDSIRENWLKDFNTPKSKQVRELFANLIDLRDVTASRNWYEMPFDQACSEPDEYVTIRGNIAHRTKHDEKNL
jgi:hypothetical protein